MPAFSTGFLINLAITAGSIAYQQSQARKARDASERAAEANRGQFAAFENQMIALPIIYGRARASGARVYHKTASNYIYAAQTVGTPIDIFSSAAIANTSYKVEVDDNVTGADIVTEVVEGVNKKFKVIQATDGTSLTTNASGEKNEFLFVEQAICVGPINKCYDILIEDGLTYNREEYKTGLIVNVHRDGGYADAMISANDTSRASAVFHDAAHAGMCFKLNRVDPQYNGVPNINFLIEGRLVYTVERSGSVYSLSNTRLYSNNPAFCLLDYLMDVDFGAGLTQSQIDLKTFYDAADACDDAAATTAVEGKIWKSTNGSRNETTHTFQKFECNMVVDTARTIRENVNQILSCMHNARLVWSGGKYKLAFIYGYSQSVGTINDSVLARDTFTLQPPSLDTKQNFCTVRFSDEAKDFKEGIATWPPRFSTAHTDMLTNDNNIALETDVAGAGITVKMLATAKAEEVVKASRNSAKVTFSVVIKAVYYEPGDVVKIESEALDLGLDSSFYVLIDEVKMNENGTANISGTRFVSESLAWNSSDTTSGDLVDLEDTSLPPPTNFAFTQVQESDTSGTLTWTKPNDKRVLGYKLYMAKYSGAGVAETGFKLLGEDTESPFEVKALDNGAWTFGIRSYGSLGRYSRMVTVPRNGKITEALLATPDMIDIAASEQTVFRSLKVAWNNMLSDAEKTRWSRTELWVFNSPSYGNSTTGGTLLTSTKGTTFLHLNPGLGTKYYRTRNVSLRNTPGLLSDMSSAAVEETINDYLDAVQQDINSDHLMIKLLEPINGVDTQPIMDYLDAERTTMLEYVDNQLDLASKFDLNGIETTLKDAATAVETRVDQIEDGTFDISVTNPAGTTTLRGIKTSADTSSAYFAEMFTVNSVAGSTAFAQYIKDMHADVGTAKADITEVMTLDVTSDSAVVTTVRGMSSALGGPGTGYNVATKAIEAYESIITPTGAAQTKLSLMEGILKSGGNPLTGGDNRLVDAEARMHTIETTAVTKETASVTRFQNMEASLGITYGTTAPNTAPTIVTATGRINNLDTVVLGGIGAAYTGSSIVSRMGTVESNTKMDDGTLVKAKTSDLLTTVSNPTTGLVKKVSDIEAAFTNNLGAAYGRITDIENVRVASGSAIVTKVNALESDVLVGGLKMNAVLLSDYNTKATQDGVTTTAMTTQKSAILSNVSASISSATAPTTRPGTPTTPLVMGDVWIQPVTEPQTGLATNKYYIWTGSAWEFKNDYSAALALAASSALTDAAITTFETTKIGYCKIGGVTTDHAKAACQSLGGTWYSGLPWASAVKQVSVTAGGSTGTIESRMDAVATKANGIDLMYTLRLNANGRITGYGVGLTGGVTTFGILADKFLITNDSNSTLKQPFAYYTTDHTFTDSNGASRTLPAGLYVENANIGKLTINAGQIQKGTIAATFAGSVSGYSGSWNFVVSGDGCIGVVLSAMPLIQFDSLQVKGDVRYTPTATKFTVSGNGLSVSSGNVHALSISLGALPAGTYTISYTYGDMPGYVGVSNTVTFAASILYR